MATSISGSKTFTQGSKKEAFVQTGCLHGGHNDWVTSIGILQNFPDRVISTSRDKSILIWKLERNTEHVFTGVQLKRLTGHSHFISDVAVTPDSSFCLTGAWDRTLRLWDLNQGICTRRFVGHSRYDVTSVALSSDNRQIISGGRDNTVKLWNTLAKCMVTMDKNGHKLWVTSVAITPPMPNLNSTVISASLDSTVKMWNVPTFEVERTFEGADAILSMAIAPDASLCAAGSKDGKIILWDLYEKKKIWSVALPGEVRALAFSPYQYRLCAAVGSSIFIYDLENKHLIDEGTISNVTGKGKGQPQTICLKWSFDGQTLFAGYSDGQVRCWKFIPTTVLKLNYEYDDNI